LSAVVVVYGFAGLMKMPISLHNLQEKRPFFLGWLGKSFFGLDS